MLANHFFSLYGRAKKRVFETSYVRLTVVLTWK
jgi:hypothetical protein